MRPFFISLSLLSVSFLAVSCKDYSTGMRQGATRADETSAIATLRTIAKAETTYNITNSGRYASFEQLVEAGLLDARFHQPTPEFHGYVFTLHVMPTDSGTSFYTCNADPGSTSPHGGRHFYVEANSQDIRVNPTQPATNKDEILRP